MALVTLSYGPLWCPGERCFHEVLPPQALATLSCMERPQNQHIPVQPRRQTKARNWPRQLWAGTPCPSSAFLPVSTLQLSWPSSELSKGLESNGHEALPPSCRKQPTAVLFRPVLPGSWERACLHCLELIWPWVPFPHLPLLASVFSPANWNTMTMKCDHVCNVLGQCLAQSSLLDNHYLLSSLTGKLIGKLADEFFGLFLGWKHLPQTRSKYSDNPGVPSFTQLKNTWATWHEGLLWLSWCTPSGNEFNLAGVF